jgi:hypothetical protein
MLQAAILQQHFVALGDRRVALCDRGVTLRSRRRKHRLQHLDVGRKLVRGLAHALD